MALGAAESVLVCWLCFRCACANFESASSFALVGSQGRGHLKDLMGQGRHPGN